MSETRTMVGDVLQAALEPLYPDAVFPNVYRGHLTEYIVWNKAINGALWAEGGPEAAIYSVQVHLYAPQEKNVTEGILAIMNALFTAGFTWPSVTDASDEEGQHYELWCEYCDGGGRYGYA